MLLAFAQYDGGFGTISPPTGWSTRADTGFGLILFTKTAVTADSGATFTFTPGSGTGARVVILSVADPIEVDQKSVAVSAGPASFYGASPPATTRPNELVIEAWRFLLGGTARTITGAPATSLVSVASTTSRPGLQVSSQAQSVAGTPPLQTTTLSGSANWGVITVSIYGNAAPNAPTVFSPAPGSIIDRTAALGVGWFFSDDDPDDYQIADDLQWSSDGGSTWHTISATASAPGGVGAAIIPGGTFPAGSIVLKVRTTDSHNATGPYSSTVTFTAATPPAGPTVTAPAPGDTEHGATVTVTWTATQDAYEVRALGDLSGSPDPTNVLYTTGQVTDASTHTVDVPLDTTGIDVHIEVSYEHSGLWSSFTDVLIHVAWTPPPTPTLTLTTNDELATITAEITVAAPTGGGPAADHVDLYLSADGAETWIRVATGLALTAEWTYWTPASGLNYLFRAAAVAASGVTAYGDIVDLSTVDDGIPTLLAPLMDGGAP